MVPTDSKPSAASVRIPADTSSKGGIHPKRYEARAEAGKLIDSEHRGRYWWAAQAVAGKEVLDAGCGVGYGVGILAAAGAGRVIGVDIDESAVIEARARFPSFAESLLRGDICRLDYPEASFDVVVCFETIHHVGDGERALGELHRVLRPGGLLLISSPSPDVYLQGNEHHVHEYRPTELAAVIEERFENVARYRQHPWLASVIEPAPNGSSPSVARRRETHATAELGPGAETYSILVASDAELPHLGDFVVLGPDFEVKWWAEQVAAADDRAREEVAEAESQARDRIAAVEDSHRQLHERIEAAENEARERLSAAAAVENELRRELAAVAAREQAARQSQLETSDALLDANQSLAMLPALQHRFDELEHLRELVEILEGSRSWRYMAPLRAIRHFFRRR